MFEYYKENKRLKKEIENLRKSYDIISNQNDMVFKKIGYYEDKLEKEENISQKLK